MRWNTRQRTYYALSCFTTTILLDAEIDHFTHLPELENLTRQGAAGSPELGDGEGLKALDVVIQPVDLAVLRGNAHLVCDRAPW